jgi:tetratricopeptide (TPR) repeat protein
MRALLLLPLRSGTPRLGILGLGLLLLGGAIPAAHAEGEPEAAYEALVRGDLASALALSEQGVRGGGAAAWRVRGFVLSQAGDPEAAARAYEEALRADPRDAIAHNNLGAVLLAQGRLDDAERALRAALALDASYADAHNNLGAVHEARGRLDAARAAYRLAAAVDPRHARAWNNLGALAYRRGAVERAARAFARAAEYDPGFAAPALNLALVGGADEGDDEWLARVEALASQPGAPLAAKGRARAARAAWHARRGEHEDARRLYLEALAAMPRDTALLNNLAVVEDALGLDRDALLHLQTALEIEPELLVARNNVGIVQVHRGRLDLAEGVFRDILAQDPAFHRAHDHLGVVHAARGERAAARASFERAARLAPDDPEVEYNLALLLRELGSGPAAERAAYERVLARAPDLAEAHLALGTLLADPATPPELRDPERAREHLERFLDLSLPSDDEGREQARAWLAWLAATR